MKALSCIFVLAIAICCLPFIEAPASARSADITGTWEVTIHYPPPDGDYLATYVLKQDGEKITGTYHGMYGPADVTGTIKSDDVALSVTVQLPGGPNTARFTGRLTSATKMSGMVTGTSDQPRKWSAEKRKSAGVKSEAPAEWR
jgi:hypothetical protein